MTRTPRRWPIALLFLADGKIVRDQGRAEPAGVLAAIAEVSAL